MDFQESSQALLPAQVLCFHGGVTREVAVLPWMSSLQPLCCLHHWEAHLTLELNNHFHHPDALATHSHAEVLQRKQPLPRPGPLRRGHLLSTSLFSFMCTTPNSAFGSV